MPSKAAWTWSRAQWGQSELGDERRQRRAVAVGAAFADASARSLPQQLQSRAAAKATYRLMDCEEVTHAALLEPHLKATRQAAQACGRDPVLFIQDGSYLDFTHRESLEGVGRIGNDRGQGFCLHSCLALEAHRGAVLGLAGQRFWARSQPAPTGETRTQRAQRRTEADLWAEMLESIGPAPEGATWVSVADRGADVYSHLAGARALNWHCVVRACQDRALEDGGYLLQQVRALAPRSQRPVRVRLGKQGPKKRLLQVAWCAVHLRPPKGPAGRGLPPEGLPVWVIRVWDETLEWVLVSTLPVEDAAAAAERIDWYSRRWSIEDYHKGLKTGCRIEASQLLRTAERFGALLGFAAIVAVRLLQLRDRARQAPGAPVAESELSQKVLAARLQVAPEAVATNLGFWRGVAQLGGFLGRKGDGEPGWQSLWRGWQELQLLLQGVELAQTLQEKCG